MINDPRDIKGDKLVNALRHLGQDPACREIMVNALKQIESSIKYDGATRDDITGPITDALHIDGDVYEKELIDGTKIRFYLRTKIARDFLLSSLEKPTHVWEPQTTKLLLNAVAESKTDVLIGGAYFGDHAILLAREIMQDGRTVHCFEPNDEQSKMLLINAKINNLNNLEVSTDGLWHTSSAKLKLQGFDSFANVAEVSGDEEGFDTITIDDYCKAKNIRVGLIQIDIEGAEYNALRGAENTIKMEHPDIVFEVHRHYVDWDSGLENTDICRFLIKHGYTVYAVRDFNTNYEMSGKNIELIPVENVYLDGPPHGFNMFATTSPEKYVNSPYSIVKNVSPKLLVHKDPSLHHPVDGLE